MVIENYTKGFQLSKGERNFNNAMIILLHCRGLYLQ